MAFMELHLHSQQLAIKHPTHWDEVGREQVLHHARALGRICRFALTRSQLVLQVYTYLRYQKSKSFMDVKLLGSSLMKWQGLALNRLPPGGGTTTQQWNCAHCHASLHQGGAKKCPFGEFKAKVARRMALETQRLTAAEPGALERLLSEEQSRRMSNKSWCFSNRYMLMKYNPPCGSVKSLHVYILFYSQAVVLLTSWLNI
jgi:hypothetical protein